MWWPEPVAEFDMAERGGLTLAQLAGIAAALAEGLPPADVFSQEEVDEATYHAADQAWRRRLAEFPREMERFAELTAIAEDCLIRPVPPLDEDPAAWAGLLCHSQSIGPLGAAANFGLNQNDVARLMRLWQRRAVEDKTLYNALLAYRARPMPMVVARPEEACLRPFPWTPSAPGRVLPPMKELSTEERVVVGLGSKLAVEWHVELYAGLEAALEAFPNERSRALSLCGLDEALYEQVANLWRARLEADADERAIFQVQLTDNRALCAELKNDASSQPAGG